MKNLLLALGISISTLGSYAQNSSHLETYFFKISMALKGVSPKLEERREFEKALQQRQADIFLDRKMVEYMNDPRFSFKMKRNIDDLLRFENDQSYWYGYASDPVSAAHKDTHYFLTNEVTANNRSWDTLLTHKKYQVIENSNNPFNNNPEVPFFDSLFSQKTKQLGLFDQLKFFVDFKSEYTENKFSFEDNDLRVSGILTTPRFMDRYVNTSLNKNRGRAAAIFRIFLCDSMVAATPSRSAESDKEDLEVIYPHDEKVTEEQLIAAKADPHGQQADCLACHYKLDPMGKVFGLSPRLASPFPSPGALTYKNQAGSVVNVPLRGVGDLGKAIVQQKEYVDCQVQHFWKWYVGQDVPLTERRKTELAQKFDEVGRKPREFIAHLLRSPEFRRKPQLLNSDQILARRAVGIMRNCNSCHANQNDNYEIKYFDLTELPYGKTPEVRRDMIDKLRHALDVDHDGAARSMPPKDSIWKLSESDFEILKKWIQSGAPDFDGKAQVNP